MEPERYELGRFVLDASDRRLTRAGDDVAIAADALHALIEMVRRPGKVVIPDPGGSVYPDLRAALGAQGEFVERIGGGIRWTGPVRRLASIDLADRKGHFEVLGLLGEGGMGQVWLVRHPVLHRRFAVKVVSASNPHLNERILREARAQARVQHVNVLEVLDVFEIDGRPAMLLPLVEGPTLQMVCSRAAPSLDAWIQVFRDVVAGVAAIHAAGLVHRDLKPSNILLDVSGPQIVPKIADFGVAKALEDHRAAEHLTGHGVALGTPTYAAPEQLRDAGSADARADVWALGCILHQLATGAPPRRAPGKVILSDLGPVWNPLIDRMIREDPRDRFPDAAAVLAALPPHRGNPELGLAVARTHTPSPPAPDTPVLATMIPSAVAPPPPEPPPPARRGPSRRALLWGGAGAVVGLGAAGIGAWWAGSRRGGTLRLGSTRARGPLGVVTSVSSMWVGVRPAVLEPLVAVDAQGQVTPVTVARWDQPSSTGVRLWLRDDLRFHDHPATPGGRLATPRDLAHTIRIAVERGWVSSGVVGVDPSDAGVTLTLARPAPFLLDELAQVPLLPVESATAPELADLDDQPWPLGTGPFRFDRRPTGERLELVAHRGYWGRGDRGARLPYVDALVATTVPLPEALGQIAGGGLDLFGPTDVASVGDAPVRVTSPAGGWCGLKGLLFPGDALPLDLRRAIAGALDREAIARGADARELEPSDRHLLPEHLGYEPALGGPPQAVAAPLGRELVIGAFASDAGLAQDVCAQLRANEIPARVARFSSQSLQRVESEREDLADVLVVELSTRVSGLDPFPLLRDQQRMIRSTGTAPGEVDQLIDRAAATDDRAERIRLYTEIERAWRRDPRFVVLGTLRQVYLAPSIVVADGVGGMCDRENRWVGPYPPSFAGVWLEH